jgi:hypothetical protein
VAAGRRHGFPLEQEGSSRVAEGGAHLRVGSMVREEQRRQLDGVPRRRRSSVARETDGGVLQL